MPRSTRTRIVAPDVPYILVPSAAVHADLSDHQFRLYVAVCGVTQELGRVPDDYTLARRIYRTRGAVQALWRRLRSYVGAQLLPVPTGLPGDSGDELPDESWWDDEPAYHHPDPERRCTGYVEKFHTRCRRLAHPGTDRCSVHPHTSPDVYATERQAA